MFRKSLTVGSVMIAMAAPAVAAVPAAAAPAHPFAWSTAINLDRPNGLIAVACPSTTQCTAVAGDGKEITFNPLSPGTPTAVSIDNFPIDALACPSITQCAAVDHDPNAHDQNAYSRVVTFNPLAPGTPSATRLAGGVGQAVGLACPATAQCTALLDAGAVSVTFDPRSPGTVRTNAFASGVIPGGVSGFLLACPSTAQCSAGLKDDTGVEGSGPAELITFNPHASNRHLNVVTLTTNQFNGNFATAVACPTARQCTVALDSGQVATLDPLKHSRSLAGIAGSVADVACPSAYQCTAIDSGRDITFNPTAPSGAIPSTIGGSSGLAAVDCPAVSECVDVDAKGNASVGLAPATTHPAGASTASTVVLHGLLDTGGAATSWQFQFGSTRSYNNETPMQQVQAGRGTVSVSWELSHLQPNTVYHFRLVNTGGRGAGQGLDFTFTTQPSGRLVLLSGSFKVSGGFVTVPLRCQSQLDCAGRLSITTKAPVGKAHKPGTVLCNTTFARISHGATKRVRTRIHAACSSLINHARRHRITAQLSSNPRTGQAGLIRTVVLSA